MSHSSTRRSGDGPIALLWLVCTILANCDPGYSVIVSHKLLEPVAGRSLHGMDTLDVAWSHSTP